MINAIRLSEELERAGFTPEQAKKSVDTWMNLINENFATKADLREFQLVSRADLKEVETNLQNEIKDLRTEVHAQIKDLRVEMNDQIKELRVEVKTELAQQSNRIILQLGGLVATLMTIGISIISLIMLK